MPWVTLTRRKLCAISQTLAVSTVIATVLMTTLTITLGTLVVFWASSTFGVYQGNAGIFFNNRGDALRESLAIEDVWFYTQSSTNYVNITVRNVGRVQLKVAALYVNNTAFTSLSPSQINVGGVATYQVQYSWVAGKIYIIIAATARGNQVRQVWST